MKKIIALLSFILTIGSCSSSEDYEKISGNWKCASWINTAKEIDKCKNNVLFKFNIDKTYYSRLGTVEDTGTYKIQGNNLRVSPQGKMELLVKITKLNNDTLEFLMNQAGEEEILTLIRKE